MDKMTKKRRSARVIRWSLAAAIVVGLVWIIYWLATDRMPTADNVQLTARLAIAPFFAVPRILDALFVGISVAATVALLTSKTMREKDDDISYKLGYGIIGGFGLGGFIAIIIAMDSGHYATGLIVGMIFAGLFNALIVGGSVGLIVGLVITLLCGATSTLFGGSIFGLTFELAAGLVYILIAVLYFVGRRVGRFLMARDR